MKQRSTTPLLFRSERASYGILLTMMVMVLFGFVSTPSSAESNAERQKRIEELTRQIDETVSSTRELNEQSESISSQIDALGRERDHLESQMQTNANDQVEITAKIKQTEEAIAKQRDVLGSIMADLYLNGSISPLEMLASSNSIADYLDAQTYRMTVQDSLNQSIAEVRATEKVLIGQRDELRIVAGQQKNQQLALSEKQSEQTSTLTRVQSQSGQLEAISAEMAAERKALQTQQQTSLAASMSGAEMVAPGTVSTPVESALSAPATPTVPTSDSNAPSPSTPAAPTPKPAPVVLPNGGYPSYLQNCYVDTNALSYGIDPWGYGCRQCVSYTAWKVLQKTGRPAMYWGNAKDWPASARRVGYSTGSSPRAGSVAVMTSGPYGHVAWVESINSNGTLNISQYNYWLPGTSNGGWGWYSEFRNVSPSIYQVYIYI